MTKYFVESTIFFLQCVFIYPPKNKIVNKIDELLYTAKRVKYM